MLYFRLDFSLALMLLPSIKFDHHIGRELPGSSVFHPIEYLQKNIADRVEMSPPTILQFPPQWEKWTASSFTSPN